MSTDNIDAFELRMKVIVGKIADMMRETNTSKEALAEKLSCSDKYVEHMLSGRLNFSIHDLTTIAEAMGYTFSINYVKLRKS